MRTAEFAQLLVGVLVPQEAVEELVGAGEQRPDGGERLVLQRGHQAFDDVVHDDRLDDPREEALVAVPDAELRQVADGRREPGQALVAERLAERAAIVLAAYGLTRREREITRQLLLGRSNKEIAAHFGLSPYTVQDHLGAIFEKAGVGNGRELIADLFFRHYLPELSRPAPPLSTDVRLLRPPAPDPA